MTNKVYVTQEGPHDFLPAQQFGEIVFLTAADLSNVKNSKINEILLTTIRRQLLRFDPEQDYIAIAGSPYVSAAVFLILGRLGHRNIRVLRWSNQSRSYTPLHIELSPEVTA